MGGRPKESNPATHRLTVNLNDVQYAKFLTMYELSGIATHSAFIADRIFGAPFRVVTTDATKREFVSKLTALYGQFRAIGMNCNQIVKHLHTAFDHKRALTLLFRVERQTFELYKIGQKVLEVCERMRGKCDNKSADTKITKDDGYNFLTFVPSLREHGL